MRYEFLKPYEFEGKVYEVIELDLDSLKGSDMSAVKKQFTAMGHRSMAPIFDADYCALVAARASKLPIEFFNEMPAKDYVEVTATITNFFA